MITYAEYVHFRDRKGLKDSDVARLAGISPATLSEWKRGGYTPKYEKIAKIEQVLGIIPLYTEDNYIVMDPAPAAPVLDKFDQELLDLYHNATDDAKTSVLTLLKASQKKSSASLKEA